jgi:hypothetical protein
VFIVVSKYCATAVWEDERRAILDCMRGSGLLSAGRLAEYFTAWWCVIKMRSPVSSFKHPIGGTRDYTAGLLSWSGIWTPKRKLESLLLGFVVYGGRGSRALTKPQLD